ncbi:MAG: YqaE/Pmp3 family membrane protein [Bacteroidia bacterium]|nr:YqaE/Pmp3 family membrane protein [Bacteroidia bacterium]
MKLIKITGIFTLVVFLASCAGNMTVAKKRYSSGYNISLFNKDDQKAHEAGQKAKAEREAKKFDKRWSSVQTPSLVTKSVVDGQAVANAIAPQIESVVLTKQNSEPMTAEAQVSAIDDVAKEVLPSLKGVKKLAFKKVVKTAKKNIKNAKSNDTNKLIYLLLILLVPFGTTIAVYLSEGNEWTKKVTTNLILTLLCGLPGLIHALIHCLGNK